ncbi:MAG: restriction endonuclease subunit S [Butyrivibrio sp.]|nr:restriction endonuclease subunit S [Butyrivibrio sp.]
MFGYADVLLEDVIVSLNTGLNPRKFFTLNTEDATNYYITIRELRGGRIIPSEKTDRMNDDALKLCNNRSNLEIGDVLFSGTGTIGETAVIEEEPNNWNIKEGVYSIKPKKEWLNPRYLRYVLMSKNVKDSYMKKVAGGTVQSIPMKDMKQLVLFLPTIDEQQRLVDIIDKFDGLCTDISEGIPAEIEARQKQYEYYRDKLLSFEEVR